MPISRVIKQENKVIGLTAGRGNYVNGGSLVRIIKTKRFTNLESSSI